MNIRELTRKAQASAKTRTPQQRAELLRKARILDAQGNFDSAFFRNQPSENSNGKA